MPLFYRVETNAKLGEREGAYNFETNLAKLAGIANEPADKHSTHPGPRQDAGLREFWVNSGFSRYNYLFGFKSIEQYKNWFMYEEGRENLVEVAVLAVYEVPEGYIKFGQFQAMAHEDYMEHLYDLNPATLEKVENDVYI